MQDGGVSARVNVVMQTDLSDVIKDPSGINVPLEYCTVKTVFSAKDESDKFVIHIQDPHANYSGQKNVANILDFMMTRYDIPVVLVEGSSIDATLSHVRGKMPKKDLEIAANQLLYYGAITGEEYLNMVSDHDMRIIVHIPVMIYHPKR
jgi:hypothetical protein